MKMRGLSRVLWSVSLPIMFAQVSEIILHVTNTIFLARVGLVELGAIGIADAIWELFLVVPLGLVDGVQILTARHIARRRPSEVGGVFNQGLTLVLIVSLGLTLLLAASSAWIGRGLVQSPAVGQAIAAYLGIACFGIPFTAANFVYGALLTSLGKTRLLVPATLVLAITNCVLDYVLIFGKLGAPALGIRGAGLASVGAEAVTFVFLTAALVRLGAARRFHLFRWTALSRSVLRRLVGISAPVSVQALVEGLRWVAFFLIVERIGPMALAVANVVYACFEVFLIPTEAFGETACSLVSRMVGRHRTAAIVPVIRRSTSAALVATLPMIALGLLLPDWVLSVFTMDDALVEAGMTSLRVVALAMLVVIPAEMWFAAVVGTGDTPAALGIELVLTVVMLSASFAAVTLLAGSIELVWCSVLAAALAGLLVSYLWIKRGAWRRLAI